MKNDKVLVQWGESGDVYEARLLKFYEGAAINLSFSDLAMTEHMVPEHLLEKMKQVVSYSSYYDVSGIA